MSKNRPGVTPARVVATVACPRCQASVDVPCTDRNGAARAPHVPRITRYHANERLAHLGPIDEHELDILARITTSVTE